MDVTNIPKTGPEAIVHALQKINPIELEKHHRDMIRNGPKSKRTKSVQALNALEGLNRNNIKPHQLMISNVPVIPPVFRPFSVVGDTFMPGDANELYKDLFQYRDMYKSTHAMFGDEGARKSKLDLYDTVKAVYGYGDPTSPKTKQRGVSGFLKQITGTGPKWCYDSSTQILTQKYGWVMFKDLPRDTAVGTINPKSMLFEWQIPTDYFDSTYDGEMVRIIIADKKSTSPRMDLLVTPSHRMWSRIRKRGGVIMDEDDLVNGWGEETAAEMMFNTSRRHIMIAAKDIAYGHAEVPDAFKNWSAELFAQWLGWWISEGSSHECGTILSIFQPPANPEYCEEIKDMFTQIGKLEKTSSYDYDSPRKVTHWNILNCRDKVEWVRDHVGLGSLNKRIPRFCLDWNSSLLRILFKSYLNGDGAKRTEPAQGNGGHTHKFRNQLTDSHKSFVTVSHGLFDDLMELGFKIGVCIRRRKGKEDYVETPAHHAETFVSSIVGRWASQTESNKKNSFESYQGTIHCCTVPNGLLVVRRNGAAVVSGNSFFQRKLISKPQDSVARGTIAIDPELSLNEVGVPHDMAWTMYAPYTQRRLVQSGMKLGDALLNINERTPTALKALETEMSKRPVIYSRAPSWHKFNVIAGRPKLVDGSTIMINPLITVGMNADFDGDAMNLHVPSQDDAVQEAWDKLMPSKMLWSIRDQDKVMPQPRQEMILGLYTANQRPSKNSHIFNTQEDALKAIKAGHIELSDNVEILDTNFNKPKPPVPGATDNPDV